ncbi:MAG: FHA domain-containing protein [Bdellovibrionales bacterium]|nr:FHA domain-containing protein [Bdellovibrionales bacterium]
MYALEINFRDGVSRGETIFIRRPQALIGATDYAHVVIDDMKDLDFQMRLLRGLGRSFSCKPVASRDGVQIPQTLEGIYEGQCSIDLGPVQLQITAIDSDLLLKESEPPDRAGVRILRQACSRQSPRFPAVVVPGSDSVVVSFVADQPVLIGRSNQCAVRLDASDISGRHARIGFESGEFWIEDLGSTNGTFVKEQQVSGRTSVAVGEPVILGRDVVLVGVNDEESLSKATSSHRKKGAVAHAPESRYPILLSMSEVARPARISVAMGSEIKVGRDPSSDLWLGAPHVSRRHCTVNLSKSRKLSITDLSMNGLAFDNGFLSKGETIQLTDKPVVLNFGGGITVGVCLTEEHEQIFLRNQGAPLTFVPEEQQAGTQVQDPHGKRIRAGRTSRGTSSLKGMGGFLGMYRTLGLRGKLFLVFSVFLVLLVLLLLVKLLIGTVT